MRYLFSLLITLFGLEASYAQQLPTRLDNLKVKDAATRTIALDDCHYLMAGFWGALQSQEPDSAFLMKVDPCGCVKWVETYFPVEGKKGAAFLDIIELENGDIAAIGVVEAEETILGNTADFQQMWSVIVDNEGQLKRSKIWGIDDFPSQLLPTLYGVPASHGWAITQASNGDLLITGRALEVDATLASTWRISSLLLRTDTSFQRLEVDFYGGPGRAELGLDLLESGDGSIWLSGQVADSATASFYGLLRQLDHQGNTIWDTLMYPSRPDADGTGLWHMHEQNGRLLLAGQSGARGGNPGTDDAQLAIFNLNNHALLHSQTLGTPISDEGAFSVAADDNGNIWLAGHLEQTAVALKFSPGFQLIDTVFLNYAQYQSLFTSVIPIPQREEVVLGGTRSRTSNTFDSLDVLFVNTGRDTSICSAADHLESYTGGVIIQIDDITTKVPEACLAIQTVCAPTGILNLNTSKGTHLYPNPVQSGNTVYIEKNTHQIRAVKIIDMHGKTCFESVLAQNHFKLPKLPPGIYSVFIQEGQKQYVSKLIIH